MLVSPLAYPLHSHHSGVDWKSLTATACFPITTDYYPDTQTVDRQFMENNYELLADDHEEDSPNGSGHCKTGKGVLQEIIAQRLMQVGGRGILYIGNETFL